MSLTKSPANSFSATTASRTAFCALYSAERFPATSPNKETILSLNLVPMSEYSLSVPIFALAAFASCVVCAPISCVFLPARRIFSAWASGLR